MARNIALIGFGESGKQFFGFLKNKSDRFVFFDDTLPKENNPDFFSFHDYGQQQFSGFDFFVSLGYHHLKKKKNIIEHLLKLGRNVPAFHHSTSFINPTASLGAGTFIFPMCNIDKEVKTGKGVLLNNSVCISHNNIIGDCCYIAPGVITSGFVEIGNETFIGTGTVISNDIKIGNNVTVGAGAVITKDIPDNCSVAGNPFRILDKPLRLK